MEKKNIRFFILAIITGVLILLGVFIVIYVIRPQQQTTQYFTIYILGGSTAYGTPYSEKFDFGRIVSYLFGHRIDGREIKVVNLAKEGRSIRGVVDDAKNVESDADVVFLYNGNNEFLQFDTIHDLRHSQRRLFDEPTVDDNTKEDVLNAYKNTLEEIVVYFKEREIPVIISSVVVNMKDWEPNRSVLSHSVNQNEIEKLLNLAKQEIMRNDMSRVCSYYQRVIDIEPGFALAYKKLADCYKERGDFEQARLLYQKAIDFDGNPYRVLSRQNQALKAIATTYQVPFVDAVQILQDASDDHLIGYNLMWDNCHPTLEGFVLISIGFAEKMKSALGINTDIKPINLKDFEKTFYSDAEYKAQIFIRSAQYCYSSATLIWNPEHRLDRSELYLNAAAKIHPENPRIFCSMAIVAAMRGNKEESIVLWQKAYKKDPELTTASLNHKYVKQLMKRIGIDNVRSLFDE